MFKITFLGAGSTIFAKNVLGDCILSIKDCKFEIALFDIDLQRLEDSASMLEYINRKYAGTAVIKKYTDRKEALRGADFIVNAVQIGGYVPCTVTDFEVPKKYGLRQTIADTLGIGGIFRALRTIPVLEDFAEDVHAVASKKALFINYSNPMAMLTKHLIGELKLNAVGLCHSVQCCVKGLYESLGLNDKIDTARWEIAGINHQAWLLKIEDENGTDMYPEIKRRSLSGEYAEKMGWDLVRHDIMHRFGYYNTESSEHTSEYNPYYIKRNYPELIDRFRIPLDEYPRRCEKQIADWVEQRKSLVGEGVTHELSNEFAAPIIRAMLTDKPYRIHGNVINNGLIDNLPDGCCVEVPCLVDRNGVSPCKVGALPEQLAALNRTNINVQNMATLAAKTKKKEYVYMAAYLDPHTAAELSLDDIKAMCDDLFEAHKDWLPIYQ